MVLLFKEKHVVPLRHDAVFKKNVVPLRPIDGGVFQRKACCALTSNRWCCVKKKHVVPLRPIDGAVVQRKACSAFTSWRCV
jgi:hypothetical protein